MRTSASAATPSQHRAPFPRRDKPTTEAQKRLREILLNSLEVERDLDVEEEVRRQHNQLIIHLLRKTQIDSPPSPLQTKPKQAPGQSSGES